ncbi:MAG: peptidase S8 [Planctomycetes bacterium]|nr:peptidase S8 [Planctomycetota bacterium]
MKRHVVFGTGMIAATCLGILMLCADGPSRAGAQDLPAEEVVAVDYGSGQTFYPGPGFSPHAIIVKFDSHVPQAERLRIAQERRCWIAGSCAIGDFHLLGIPQSADPEQMVEVFAQHESVEYAELDYYVRVSFVPDDRLYPYQWNLNNAAKTDIRMQAAWEIETGDPNVIVAVIDTGVAYEDFDKYRQAPDLAKTRFVPGYDFVHDDDHPNDDHGHGTHVAGTIAQSTNNRIGVAGVAFNCSIMPIKAMDEQGIGDQFLVARAILFAVAHGARVINLSAGSPQSSNTLRQAVRTAYERGVTVVAAAGNDFTTGNRPSYPAAEKDFCIGVGAVRFDLKRSPYSNTGSYVSIVAPGGDLGVDQNLDGYPDGILQQAFRSDPNEFAYWFFQGTSMAAPHVSGVAALLASRGVTEPDKIREAIERTARDLGPRGRDNEYGWGMLDAQAALSYWMPDDRNGSRAVEARAPAVRSAATP